ncbi:MAG TPA: hypothetical protein PLL77_11320 [Pyrinomonadaceae bacterium]|nr:hypothetical protein [Pyrinomonadaceae bacterium]
MKYFILLSLLFISALTSSGQTPKTSGPNFDTADFSKKSEIAQWLVEYDEVAWKTSDVLMTEDKTEIAKLGAEWFCFQDGKKLWHAVYGKFANDKYDLVFHYLFDSAGKITKTTDTVDQKFLNTHARALTTAKSTLTAKIPANSPRFNQYIRQNSDKTFNVWMLPAFQPDGTAVFGGEGIYQIDGAGSKIIADTSYFQKNFRGFKTNPPREIWLDYREVEKPTLGSIFFVLYYKAYFTNIFIDNSKSTSSIIKDDKVGYFWVNVEKEEKKTVKPN